MEKDLAMAWLRLFIFLPLVLLLAYVTVRYGLGRAYFPGKGGGRLRIVDRLPVGQKSALLVVRCGERYFLIGVGDGTPALLAELPDFVEGEQGELGDLEEMEGAGENWWEMWRQRFQR
ncbi:MAG: flagellar biosynthetic protein FliO [Moorellaceae bacterium]